MTIELILNCLPIFTQFKSVYSRPSRLIHTSNRMTHLTINPTGKTHTASVFFFHGSGDSGPNIAELVSSLIGRNMDFPHIKVIYPTAPLQPFTAENGQPGNVWFDRTTLAIRSKENKTSMAKSYKTVYDLIEREVRLGIPAHRIIVGGYSMGGAMAIHTGYHVNTNLAGVFACSAFLNRDSIVYESLKNRTDSDRELPELKMFHGDRDEVVPFEWGKESFVKLQVLGVKGEFTTLYNTLHELVWGELLDIQKWINKKLPLKDNL